MRWTAQVKRWARGLALVELQPETGASHQLRVHLAQALHCPVLGDHKYSHSDRYAPQKLPADLVAKLGLQPTKVRQLPMHLHASQVKSHSSPLFFRLLKTKSFGQVWKRINASCPCHFR